MLDNPVIRAILPTVYSGSFDFFPCLQTVTGSPIGDILGVASTCVVRCGKGH